MMIIINIEISLGCQLNHSNAKIGVVDVEIVGYTPHHHHVHPLLLQFPSHRPRGAREAELGIFRKYVKHFLKF